MNKNIFIQLDFFLELLIYILNESVLPWTSWNFYKYCCKNKYFRWWFGWQEKKEKASKIRFKQW